MRLHLPTRRVAWAALISALLALALVGPGRAWDGDRMRIAATALGPRAQAATRDLQTLLTQWAQDDSATRLQAVNSHFNRQIAFNEDAVVWQHADHWASPLESLSKGEGDCEDYAIAKYFTLIAVGVPAARLRLVYVRALLPATALVAARAQAHMVLAYYDAAAQDAAAADDPMILDNLVTDIRRASRRTDLTPVFSFNGEGLWQGAGAQSAGDPLARLSRWREVLRKARAEGFL